MKLASLCIGLAVCLVGWAPQAMGQATGNGAEGPGVVAVLDVVRVFNENEAHSTEMDQIRVAADQVKKEVEAELQKLRAEAEPLAQMEAGSPARNQLEAELEQKQAALRTKARQQEMDLLGREAQVYYKTWTRMQQVIATVAQHNNISLVLRFDSAEIDPENRADVIKGVNRSVIYHERLDMTDLVIQGMGPTVASAGAAGAAGAPIQR